MFFVISGFLITGLMVTEIERSGTLSLLAFYGRRMKRLLPAVVVILGVVAILSWVVYSPVEQSSTAWDIVSAGLYVINWRLALQATDYFGAAPDASPLQHFWTLAVEEQFYVVWPVVALVAIRLIRLFRSRLSQVRRWFAVVLAVIAVPSFVYGLHLTSTDASFAYFSTFARAWEFALGAALGVIAIRRYRYPRIIAYLLAWSGLAALIWSITTLSSATPFPGAVALVPTLGSLALIAAGFNEHPVGITRVLGTRLLRHFGRLSYSWYLWHWPLLVFAAAAWGDLSLIAALTISAASYIPARITHRWVEQPIRHHPALASRPRTAIAVGTACTAASVVTGIALLVTIPQFRVLSEDEARGATIVLTEYEVQEQKKASSLRPSPLDAYADRSKMAKDGCLLTFRETESPDCTYGDRDAKKTIVLVGDSTAMHYFPALDAIARKKGWRLIGGAKAGCSIANVPRYSGSLKREWEECYRWRTQTIERIIELEPEMVVTAGRADVRAYIGGEWLHREESAPHVERGWAESLQKLKASGAEIVLMQDTPRPDVDIPRCVSSHMNDLRRCAFDREEALDFPPSDSRAARRVGGIHVINITPYVCNRERCPAVIGDVVVYRKTHHFTATFMKTLRHHIEKELPSI